MESGRRVIVEKQAEIPQNELKIKRVPISQIRPFARNSRTHSAAQVEQLAKSMQQFGFMNPILVDQEMTVIAGHGRLLAATKLGLKKVPVIVADHLTPEQRRAYVIADNRIAENAGWDRDLLRLELLDLKKVEFDLPVLGFNDAELERLTESLKVVDGSADRSSATEKNAPKKVTCPHCHHKFRLKK